MVYFGPGWHVISKKQNMVLLQTIRHCIKFLRIFSGWKWPFFYLPRILFGKMVYFGLAVVTLLILAKNLVFFLRHKVKVISFLDWVPLSPWFYVRWRQDPAQAVAPRRLEVGTWFFFYFDQKHPSFPTACTTRSWVFLYYYHFSWRKFRVLHQNWATLYPQKR